MNYKIKSLIIIFLIFSFNSCSDEKRAKLDIYENIIDNVQIKMEKIRQFKIQENDSLFIGSFLFAKYRNGNLVIGDYLQPKIYFINKANGKIEKTIKFNIGKGPGEVIKIGSFEILDQYIYISDMGNFRWSVFDTSGRFIRTARPFSDAPKVNKNDKSQGKYIGNGNIMDVFDNKIYNCIIETEYNRDLHYHKSKSLAVLDTSLKIINVFGYYDEIFERKKTYFQNAVLTINKDGFIYHTQAPTFRIYKYNCDGSLIKVFGVRGKFREINEDIPANLPVQMLMRKWLDFSVSDAIFSSDKGYIFYQFVDRTEELYKTRDLLRNNYFLKIYDFDGNFYKSDIKLPGWLIAVDENGYLYIYENNEPGNRRIGVYDLKIFGN